MERWCIPAKPLVSLAVLAIFGGFSVFPASPQINAEGHLPTASAISPELRGDLAMARQQYLAAIEAYREAPDNSAQIWNKLGIAYHHLFAMDEARRDYQRALRLRPDFPEALNNLGAVYYARHSYRKAEGFYKKAIKLNPQAASVYSNLGTDYFAERKLSEGMTAYRTAFALDPQVFANSSPALVSEALPARARAQQDFCIARLLAASGHYDQAFDFLRKALDEGFDNRKAILQDETLASLRSMPQFSELMSEQKLR
jgi:tetratricopeptide (TPR) repeat protein